MVLCIFTFAARADTNSYPILVTADGHSYTNAHIYRVTPIEITFSHDMGATHVALTNLTEPLRSQYPYDSNNAAQYPAFLKQQEAARKAAAGAAAAARQAWLAEQAKNAGLIQITDVNKQTRQYTALINGQSRTIYLNNSPAGLAENANFAGAKYHMAEASYVSSGLRRDDVGQIIALQSARDALDSLPPVRAFYIGTASDGIPIWQCVTKVR